MSVFTCTAATLKNASFPLGDAIFMAGTVSRRRGLARGIVARGACVCRYITKA